MRHEPLKPIDPLIQTAQTPVETLPGYNQAQDIQVLVGDEVEQAIKGRAKIDLAIDWDSLDRQSLFEGMKTFDDAENLYPKVSAGRYDGYVIYEAELSTRTGEKLVINFLKVISPNFNELQIDIVRPNIPEDDARHHVANFDFLQRGDVKAEEWDMKHRKTWPSYRQQGIAEKMLDLTAEILKERSKLNGLSQSITSIAIQKDLINWLRKRGFVPATDQDIENLRRIEAGDENLLEVSKFGETYIVDLNEIRAKFGGTLPDLNDPEVWDNANFDNPLYHMNLWQNLKFKVKLKKEL